MSTSTAAFAPGIARFAMIFVLQSMCLWLPAVGSLAGEIPAEPYRFEAFSAADLNSDRSAAAAQLWKFVASQLRDEYGDEPASIERMRDDFMFAAIGPDTFLVMGPGFYVVKPSIGVFERITPVWHANAIDLPVFHSLPRGGAWALVRVDTLRHGQRETVVGALFVGGGPAGPDQPAAIYASIGTFDAQPMQEPRTARIVARSP
jgi:hypothetical protein